MAGHTTKPYKNTFSGSVGAGMGSLFNPGGRKYYILEHKVSSRYHKAGESQEIIVDNIEIGRDAHCQVRFDESFKTVSRHHAAIVRDGDNWKLVQISKTNRTLLNGHPVQTEWYLQNGDEIQLSINGPKLGFIIPTGKKSTVGSIGLTRRLSLFRQQALRPYKTAITVLSCVLVLCMCGGGYVIYKQNEKLKDNTEALKAANEANKNNEALIAELKRILANQGGILDSLKNIKPEEPEYVPSSPSSSSPSSGNIDMSVCHPYIYHIRATLVNYNIGTTSGWLGTGFQLSDGKFVTARHVCTPYYPQTYTIQDGRVVPYSGVNPKAVYKELMDNIAFQQGEAVIEFECVSTGGTYQFSSKQTRDEGNYDEVHQLQVPYRVYGKNGEVLMEVPAGCQIRIGKFGDLDYSYVPNGQSQGLVANRDISVNLKQGTQLYILGYPHGWGEGGVPILSTAMCSQNGVSKDFGGAIMASNDNSEQGNSGGPIFIKNGNEWEVVAIVSAGILGKTSFVPIAAVP